MGAGPRDGAERSLDAALAMLETIATENVELERRYGVRLSLRIGVNTGEILGGPGSLGRTGPTLGRTVNVAQRLESTAVPNTVHVGEGTYKATRRSFRFEAAPLLSIPDSGGVERSYTVTARRPSGSARALRAFPPASQRMTYGPPFDVGACEGTA